MGEGVRGEVLHRAGAQPRCPTAERTGKVLGEFCRCYKEQFGVALFNSVRYEIEGNGGPQAQLLHRKVPLEDHVIYSGNLFHYIEENKKWRNRFCVVPHNYGLVLYENKLVRGIPRRWWAHPTSLSCSAPHIILPSLAGVTPKLGQTPIFKCPTDFPLILWHPYARHYYFCVMTGKEQEKWRAVFQDCVRHCNNGISEHSKVEAPAFTDAVRMYRQSKEQYGTWDMLCGNETQVLSNLVMEELLPELRNAIGPRLKGKAQERQRTWIQVWGCWGGISACTASALCQSQHSCLHPSLPPKKPSLFSTSLLCSILVLHHPQSPPSLFAHVLIPPHPYSPPSFILPASFIPLHHLFPSILYSLPIFIPLHPLFPSILYPPPSTVRKKFFREALLQITIPFLLKKLAPTCKGELAKYQELIFEDFASFILVENTYEEVVLQSVMKDIMQAVKEAAVQRKHNLYRDSVVMHNSDPNLHLLGESIPIDWGDEQSAQPEAEPHGDRRRRAKQVVSVIQDDDGVLPYAPPELEEPPPDGVEEIRKVLAKEIHEGAGEVEERLRNGTDAKQESGATEEVVVAASVPEDVPSQGPASDGDRVHRATAASPAPAAEVVSGAGDAAAASVVPGAEVPSGVEVQPAAPASPVPGADIPSGASVQHTVPASPKTRADVPPEAKLPHGTPASLGTQASPVPKAKTPSPSTGSVCHQPSDKETGEEVPVTPPQPPSTTESGEGVQTEF
uniref:Niban apoptosis regulator 2 n=1 Tax=Amazona collaria TaxID=241587 RepID=A0A8B9FXQ3_9PSIT